MNPWLTIPLEDYEAHMSLPAVNQAALMADILACVCDTYRPASLALLGCAGGLGLDRVDPASRVEDRGDRHQWIVRAARA